MAALVVFVSAHILIAGCKAAVATAGSTFALIVAVAVPRFVGLVDSGHC